MIAHQEKRIKHTKDTVKETAKELDLRKKDLEETKTMLRTGRFTGNVTRATCK